MLVSSEERGAAAAGGGEVSPLSGPRSVGGPSPRPSRRSFSAEYKLAIVAEYENAPNGEKGAVLRREGLYSSHVIEWTRARDAGLAPEVRIQEPRRAPAVDPYFDPNRPHYGPSRPGGPSIGL